MEHGGNIPNSNIELLAPNGNKSNLNHEQWHLVRTPQFKQWFGDWEKLAMAKIKDSAMDEVTLANISKDVSKVVDENGEPMVCYHSTNVRNINEFKTEGSIETFGGKVKNYGSYWTPKQDYIGFKGDEYYTAFLKIINPLYTEDQNYSAIITADKKEMIDINGNDGVVLNRWGKTTNDELVVFESNQIKLADGTNTTFDGNNDDIRYEDGGSIKTALNDIEKAPSVKYWMQPIYC